MYSHGRETVISIYAFTVSKIVFINRYFYPDISATSQMLTDLSVSLAREGRRVVVVSSRQSYQNPAEGLPANEMHKNVEIRRVWSSGFGRMNLAGRAIDYISFYVTSLWMLFRLVQPGDIVVAKTDPPLISIVACLVTRVRKAVLVNWIQDLFPEVASALGVVKRPLVLSPLMWLRDLSLHAATENVVIGERMRDRLLEHSVNPGAITVIPNWADGRVVRPVASSTNTLRTEWGLQDKFVVGYSGNMGRAHDYKTIIDAMRLLQGNDSVVFLFIGGGKARDGIEIELKKQGLRNYLFKSYQPRDVLSESLSVPDLHLVSLLPVLEGLIVPSKFYGICAAGRAVAFIGDTKGEIAGLIQRCECGFSSPPGAGGELAERITELQRNPGSAEAIGRNARHCFEQSYDLPIAVESWKDLLSRVAV